MAIEYPGYMQVQHEFWLDGGGTGADDTKGLTLAIKNALATNPYLNLVAYNPATDVAAMATAISTFSSTVSSINAHTDYDTYHTAAAAQIDATISPETYIVARTQAHATALDTELNAKVIPRYNAGMRDINAVQTSAFVIGRAIIELDRNDKVDKFMADMRFAADAKRGDLIQAATNEMIRLYLQKIELGRVIAAITIEQLRLAIAANADYKTDTRAIEADEARWPLEAYKYGANMLASIGGGTTSSVPMDGNKTARIIGAGLSGAIMGASIGSSFGGNGAGYGALLGGALGAFGGG
jgi:hypothetical protein